MSNPHSSPLSSYQEFLSRFEGYNVYQLVNSFNKEVGSTAWTSGRGNYIAALVDTLQLKSINVDAIKQDNAIVLKDPIYIDRNNNLRRCKLN